MATQIKFDSAAAQTGSGQTPINRFFRADNTDSFGSTIAKVYCPSPEFQIRKSLRQGNRPKTVSTVVQIRQANPSSNRRCENNSESSVRPLAASIKFKIFSRWRKAIEKDRHCPDVERVRSEPNHMRSDPLQFAEHHADNLCAFREFRVATTFPPPSHRRDYCRADSDNPSGQ